MYSFAKTRKPQYFLRRCQTLVYSSIIGALQILFLIFVPALNTWDVESSYTTLSSSEGLGKVFRYFNPEEAIDE